MIHGHPTDRRKMELSLHTLPFMAGMLEKSKELNVIENIVKITSSVSDKNISELDELAHKLAV